MKIEYCIILKFNGVLNIVINNLSFSKLGFKKKRFYNIETIAASNYEIHQMSFIPSFPSMQLKKLPLFLILGSKPIMKKWTDFQLMLKPYYY